MLKILLKYLKNNGIVNVLHTFSFKHLIKNKILIN